MAEGDELGLFGQYLDRLEPDLQLGESRSQLDQGNDAQLHIQGWPQAIHSFGATTQDSDRLKGAATSLPIAASAQRWDWPPAVQANASTNHLNSLSAPGALFLEPNSFPDFSFSPSPLDRSASLRSGQRTGSFETPPVQASSPQQEGPGMGKSFKELHAERNKQAQRRFRKRQKEKMVELQSKLAQLNSEKVELERRRHLLSSACQLRDEELTKIKQRQSMAAEAEEDELSMAFKGGVTLTFREDANITLTPEQIKGLSEQELAKFWSTYVKELAVLLVAVAGTEDPPPLVAERIKALVQEELLHIYVRAALTNMQSVKKFIAKAKIEEVRFIAGPNTAVNRWRDVSKALELSPEQSRAIVQLWHEFVQHAERLSHERRKIHEQIQATMHDGSCYITSSGQYLQAHELMEQLKKNLREEHVVIHQFLVDWYTKKLTTLQMARCFVRSFPFYPDIPAIAAWVAIGENDALGVAKLPIIEASTSPANSS